MVRKKNDPPFRPAEVTEQKPMSRSERALTAFRMFPMTIHELAGTLQCTYRQAANTVSQLRHMKKLVRHEEVPRDGRGGPARTSRWRAPAALAEAPAMDDALGGRPARDATARSAHQGDGQEIDDMTTLALPVDR